MSIKEPSLPDISSKALELLIDGFIRSLNITKTLIRDVLELCCKYYDKPFHIVILDNRELNVSILNVGTNDTSITSKKVIYLNNNDVKDVTYTIHEIIETREEVGICSKRDINVKQLSFLPQTFVNSINKSEKYTAVFKIGGITRFGRDDCTDFGSKYCDLILYSQHMTHTPLNFNVYYYKLPQLPFLTHDNNAVYSDTYGLVAIGNFNGEISMLNLYKNDEKEIRWNNDKLPKSLTFSYQWSPNYCFINDKELFIANGDRGNGDYIKQTSIYNLETKQHKILKENESANCRGAIKYNYNTNTVWISGGSGVNSSVYCYDLHKNIYITDVSKPRFHHKRPILYLNEQGTIIHIASIDVRPKKLRYEWIDLRSAEQQYKCEWIYEEKIADLSQKIWQKMQFLSAVNFE